MRRISSNKKDHIGCRVWVLREDFLQQSSFSDDAFCPLEKTYWMLKVILFYYDQVMAALHQSVSLEQALIPELLDQIARAREWPATEAPEQASRLMEKIEAKFKEL